MPTTQFHILVVDDYEPWRRFCSTILQQQPELRVIGYAADGVEAVSAAIELQPDLILLDIGLPLINGIDAAQRILEVCPKSRILCVSVSGSRDVVEEALRAGASGYVIKSQAGNELLRAVRTVLRGQRFISAGLHARLAASSFNESAPARGEVPKLLAPILPLSRETRNHHEVEFYYDDRVLLTDVTRFIGTALKAGDGAVAIATESHGEDLLRRLRAFGVNMSAAIEEGRYVATDAANAISECVANGTLDGGRFVAMLSDPIMAAAKAATTEHPRVALFGEGCHILWTEGHAEAVIEAEKIGTQLTEKYEVDMLCGYALNSAQGERDARVFEQICAEHSAVHLAG